MRFAFGNGLVLLLAVLASGPLRADLFWKVAAQAPLAPQVSLILGDDQRTIAFGTGGTWEFDGTGWVKVRLLFEGKETLPGTPVFAGGRFFSVSHPSYGLRVHVLDGSTWRPFTQWPGFFPPHAFGADRLYVSQGPFGACRNDGCNPDSTKWGSLISVSLADGSVRTEHAPPACSGELFVVKGRLFLVATPPGICGGPGRATTRPALSGDEVTPFFRLDPSGWTALPPVPVPPTYLWANAPLQFTPSTIWATWKVTASDDWEAHVFDGERWSERLSLPRGRGAPVEWNGQVIHVALKNRESLYGFTGSGLVSFAPNSPFRRPAMLFSAGSRLFAWSGDNAVFVLSGGEWRETSGIEERPGSPVYFSDGEALFTLMGGNAYRMDAGWKRLPPPGSSEATSGFVYEGRIGVTDLSSWPVLRLLRYSDAGRWEDLGLPAAATFDDPEPQILQFGGDLYVAGRIDELYRLREGRWSRIEGLHEGESGGLRRLRLLSGQLFLVGDSKTNRLEGDQLVAAFPELPEGWSVRDVAESKGSAFLLVATPGIPRDRNRPLVVESAQGSWRTVVRASDLGDLWLPYVDDLRLEPIADHLFVGWDNWWHWMEISRGRLKALRGELPVQRLYSQGEFGTSHGNVETYGPGKLLRPVVRVRKTIPAIVDTEGLGGKYRSTLLLGNFSSDRTATARLYGGPDTSPCREVDLPPGAQARIEGLLPGFVGPLTIDFDGLAEDDEGWAAVRVWNEAEGGTAGVALEGQDAGTLVLEAASLLLPNPRAGTRTHLAAAAAMDGGRETIFTTAHNPLWREPASIDFRIPAGGFVQVDPDPGFAERSITFGASGTSGDLLPYSVRNDDRTQDGVVVQAGPRWLKPGAGTVFIPAAIAVSTDKASYRTELAIASSDLWTTTPLALRFRGDSAGRAVDATVRVVIPVDGILRVDDVGDWLSANGVPIAPEAFDGTITIDPDQEAGPANLIGYVAVLGRGGPSARGDYSTSVPIFPEAEWASSEAIVPGLREGTAFRSNLAMANPEPAGGPSVTLSVTVRDDSGLVAGRLPSITLQPGERRQLNQALRLAGKEGSGWVELRRISGAGRFVAYGVVNDNQTGDGTVFRMVRSR